MIDEKLDPATHDMAYSGYDEQIVSDAEQVLQNIKIRLLFIKGEFFLNTQIGTIDFDTLASKNNVKNMVDAAIKATIKDTPEVTSILSYESTLNGPARTLNINFTAETIYGPVKSNTMGIEV